MSDFPEIRNRPQLKRFVPAALGQPQIGAPGRGGLTASASKTLCIETRITRFTNQSDDSIHIGNSWGIPCNSWKMCFCFFCFFHRPFDSTSFIHVLFLWVACRPFVRVDLTPAPLQGQNHGDSYHFTAAAWLDILRSHLMLILWSTECFEKDIPHTSTHWNLESTSIDKYEISQA